MHSTRGALPRLEVMGSATTSANPGLYEFDQSGTAMADAILLACERSGIEPAQLAAYSSSASGMTDNDEIEAKVLSGLLSRHTAVTAPRGVLGETWSSATLAGALVADLVADSGLVPPIAGLRDPLTTSLNFVTERAEQVRPGPVLLTANALGGTASASVLAPYGGA